MKLLLSFISLLFIFNSWSQDWKEMMHNPQYNIYEVCAAADKYFETHDPNVKGSGWKGYQRWRDANESKYAPSGDRTNADPFFVEKEFSRFVKNNPSAKAIYGSGWKELGPWSIDSITGHYSAGLGRIEDMYIDPNNTNRIYVGSRSGGFWRTTDEGANWAGTTDSLFASGVNAITARPSGPENVFINVRNAVNGHSHGIYKSSDSGDSWTETNFNPTNTGFGGLGNYFLVYEMEYHPTISNLMFVGTSNGIYRSTDELNTYTQLLPTAEIRQIKFHPTDPNIIYAYDGRSINGNRSRVYVSTDAGLTWTLSSTVAGNNNQFSLISVSTACPDCLFFHSSNGVWKSEDQGGTFAFISNPGEGRGAFAVSDTDTSVMVIGSIDPFVTNDGAQNFQQSGWWSLGNNAHGPGSLAENYAQTDVYVHADLRNATSINGVLYIATDGFLSKSIDNGLTWEILSKGTAIRENYTLGISQSNHFVSMIGSQDNGTSLLGENDWVEFYGADGMEAIIHPLNPDWMMGSFQYGGRRRTYNRGLTQNGATPPGESGSGDAAWVAPLVYDPNDPFKIYHFSEEVWTSDDFGENWDLAGTPTSLGGGTIAEAAVAENNSDILIVSRASLMQVSMDAGATYSSINQGLPSATIKDIAFDPIQDSTLIAVYDRYQIDNNKVFITQDLGQTWTNITYNLGNMPIRSVVIDHTDAKNIYLGAEIGVYTMKIGDTTWSLYNPDFPNVSVRELEINYGSNTLRAATWGRGMWEYTLKDRIDFPAIMTTEIDSPPTFDEPKEDIDQYVTSKISYVGTLSSVYTEWSINTPTFGNMISMSNISDSTWKTNTHLPNFPEGTKLYFKVFAVGSTGDTTETYKFTYTVRFNQFAGLTEVAEDFINLFPNPSTGNFTIDLGTTVKIGKLIVLTLDGKTVWEKSITNTQLVDCKTDLSNGAYFVVVDADGNTSVRKIVVRK